MCYKNLIYPAIIEQDGEGFCVTFPDLPGCFTDGETVLEAFINAGEALALYIHDEKNLPTPSDVEGITVPDGAYLMLIAPNEEDNVEYVEGYDLTEILEKSLAANKYTKYRVSKILGINESYVNRIVSGKQKPSPHIAQKLAALLGLDWRIFFPVAAKV